VASLLALLPREDSLSELQLVEVALPLDRLVSSADLAEELLEEEVSLEAEDSVMEWLHLEAHFLGIQQELGSKRMTYLEGARLEGVLLNSQPVVCFNLEGLPNLVAWDPVVQVDCLAVVEALEGEQLTLMIHMPISISILQRSKLSRNLKKFMKRRLRKRKLKKLKIGQLKVT